ncbi:MAG: FkbM family methyltransferase [Alphaproteobacteria bacterium]
MFMDFGLEQILHMPLPTIDIVDIGAAQNGEPCYYPLIKAKQAMLTGFEPVEAQRQSLECTQTDNARYLPYVVGDGTRHQFIEAAFPLCSSIFPQNRELTTKFHVLSELMDEVRRSEVETVRLDDMQEMANIDYLKMDAEGSELSIIEGGKRKLSDAVVIHTEVCFVPLREGMPLFAEIDQALRKTGFLFHFIAGSGGRCFKPISINSNPAKYMNQVLWADVVYVRDFTKLDTITPEKLLKMAIILHNVYKSVDLCFVCLKMFDDLTGSRAAFFYQKAITFGVV